MPDLSTCHFNSLNQGDFTRLYDQDQNGELHHDELVKAAKLDEFISRFVLTGSPDILAEYLGSPHAMDAALKDAIRTRLGQIQDGNSGELKDCLDAEDLNRVNRWLTKEFSMGWLRADVALGFQYDRTQTDVRVEFGTGADEMVQKINSLANTYVVPGTFGLSGTLLKGALRLDGGISAALRGEFARSTTDLALYNGAGTLLIEDHLKENQPSFGYDVTPRFVLARRDGRFSLTLDGNIKGTSHPTPNSINLNGRVGGTLRLRPLKKGGLYILASGAYHNLDYAAPQVEGHLTRDDNGGSARAEIGIQPTPKWGASLGYDFNGSNVTHALDHAQIQSHMLNLSAQIKPLDRLQLRGKIEGSLNQSDAEYINGLLPASARDLRLGAAFTTTGELFKNFNPEITLGVGGASVTGSASGSVITSRLAGRIRWTPQPVSLNLGLTHTSEGGDLTTEVGQEILRQKDDYILDLGVSVSPRDFFEASIFAYLHNQQEKGFQADRTMTVVSVGTDADWRFVSLPQADFWLGASLGYERYLDENRFVPGVNIANDYLYGGVKLRVEGLKLAGQK